MSSQKLAEACQSMLPAEDCQDLAEMSFEDALGYAFTLLTDKGIQDPKHSWQKKVSWKSVRANKPLLR